MCKLVINVILLERGFCQALKCLHAHAILKFRWITHVEKASRRWLNNDHREKEYRLRDAAFFYYSNSNIFLVQNDCTGIPI